MSVTQSPTAVTVERVADWLGITQRPDVVTKLLQGCLDAAVAQVARRLGDWVPQPWPDDVEQAVTMQAGREYKRRNSPEGFAGFGDMGVVRVTSLDPDVENLLGPNLAFWFGGSCAIAPAPVAGPAPSGVPLL